MDLKNKAGLALALAAIFTTGGANAAFALAGGSDNFTADADGTVTIEPGSGLETEPGETLDLSKVDPGTNEKIVIDNTNGGTVVISSNTPNVPIIVDGGTVLLDGSVPSVDLALKNATAPVTGENVLTTLAANENTLIQVGIDKDGNSDTPGIADVGTADLDGGTIFADPDFVAGKYGPSQVTINAFGDLDEGAMEGKDIDGLLIAGRNSTITIGSESHKLVDQAIEDIGLDRWGAGDGQYSAAMAFIGRQTIDLTQGGLLVDGGYYNGGKSLTYDPVDPEKVTTGRGAINFADNSLAVFDLTNVGHAAGEGALAADGTNSTDLGTITIGATHDADTAAGAYFANAVNGERYIIFEKADNFVLTDGTLAGANADLGGSGQFDLGEDGYLGVDWTGDNLHFSSGLFDGKWTTELLDGGGYNLVLETTYNADYIGDVVPLAAAGTRALIDGLFGNELNKYYTDGTWNPDNTDGDETVDGSNAKNHRGMQYVAYIVDLVGSGAISDKEGAALLDGMSQIVVAGGVPYLTSNVITKVSSLIVNHNNMLNATQPAYGNEPGQLGIWATPFYGLSDVDGMSAGRLETGTELSYGGAAFGIDYNLNEAFRLGLALNVGGGTSDSEDKGDFMKTENDFDFFGGSIYGSYSNGAFGLTGDLGYTAVDSEITMAGGPGGAFQGTSGYRADVDSDAFTVGLTGKYRFTAGENLNVAPHLGLRYTKISTDNTTSKTNKGEALFDIDTDDQNLFQIPVGVEFSSNFVTDGGWTITPRADLGVLFTTGDTDVDTRTRYAGTGIGGLYNAEVVDEAAFSGSLGIKAQADNGLSLGLDYGILAGGNQTDHQFTGMLRFEF